MFTTKVIEVGDIVNFINGKAVTNAEAAAALVATTGPSDILVLDLERLFSVALDEYAAANEAAAAADASIRSVADTADAKTIGDSPQTPPAFNPIESHTRYTGLGMHGPVSSSDGIRVQHPGGPHTQFARVRTSLFLVRTPAHLLGPSR